MVTADALEQLALTWHWPVGRGKIPSAQGRRHGMSENAAYDEKAIIERALESMHSNEPTAPRESVKKFLALVGEEIKHTGELRQEAVDRLLQQLHAGAI
jgi:hypothetical protein